MHPFPTRRQLLALAASGLLLGHPVRARAQAATDALRVLCGYPAGGPVDIVSRKLAEKLSQRTGTPAVVDNRTGAAGRLAVGELKRAPANGRHLLLTPASVLTMYPHVYLQLGYDVFSDLQPVCTVAATVFALAVGPKVPPAVSDCAAFVQWCRANRGASQCGNAGAGSMPHFLALLLAREAGAEMDHIPYRGGILAMQAAAAGDIAAALATESAARALHEAGKLRILATSGSGRSSTFPQAPTFRELGLPMLVQREWFGVFAPGGTPAAAIAATGEHLRTAVAETDVRDLWARNALQVDSLDALELRGAMRREHDFWGPVIRQSGFTPQS